MDKFNTYVESEILPKLNSGELSPDQILTGLQFILINELPDYKKAVLELLTIRHVGDQDEEIYKSALRVAEYYDIAPRAMVRALVESMLVEDHSRRDPLYLDAVRELGLEAALIMLDMMQPHRKAGERRELVGLIDKTSTVKPPQIWSKWVHFDDGELTRMKQVWEGQIDPEGEIRTGLDQLAILSPIDPGKDGVLVDGDGPTEEVGGGAIYRGENWDRLDESKTRELMPDEEEELVDVRQGIPPNAQAPRPSALPKPIAQPKPMEWQLVQWSTYTAPMWVLLGGIAVSLVGMICVVARYRRARRRRIQSWNHWNRA